MSVAVPAYTYTPPPSYASLPLPNEDTVQYTPRAGRTTAVLGNLTKQWRDVTVIFKNQDASSGSPTYGRNSQVSGEIGLENSESISTISLKLEGRINLSSSDCGSIVQKIVDERTTLWDVSKSGRCPSVVGFALAFPMTYKDQNRVYRLPPSYETVVLGSPLLVVKLSYKLSVTITKTKSRRIAFWKTACKTYPIHIIFRPRTRPARPILEDSTFFSTFKHAPSEWHQMVVPIPPRRRATVEPISCHFVIPSVQTFCLSEDIPFHIQLCGPLDSLRQFYGVVPLSDPLEPGKRPRRRPHAAILRVYLARQIYVEVNGRQSWRTINVGEGKLRAIPPVASSNHDENCESEVAVDWEGEVRCKSDVTIASFNISSLVLKVSESDFIIFALTPANPRTSPLLPIQHAHPIRLVTDGWSDQDAHPQDR
ncbi:hypothetical protein B0H17DRAFT_1041441 [Mycena rosella]|uniref:Uncharacterized protein n=1 Tax=Mycena rosella TaxID=1033263 RepID=A0AAD7GR26_MYCRO|nr:hypothetical protein B0H17DRAFT_1041441 [Mycena rosella]